MNLLKDSVIITAIEAGGFLFGVGAWFLLHGRGHPILGAVVGTAIWSGFTFIEHAVALNVGAGRPPFAGIFP